MEENLDFIEDFKLPNGGTYTGQCKMNGRFVELKGQGEACYPDGSTFKGVFNYGRPLGLGKYLYPNGDFYWGYFNDLPNGACYLSEYDGSCFALGHFVDGDLWQQFPHSQRNEIVTRSLGVFGDEIPQTLDCLQYKRRQKNAVLRLAKVHRYHIYFAHCFLL